jgi:hypothetical protein
VTQPSVVVTWRLPPVVTRGVDRTKTSASRITNPRVSFARTRTVSTWLRPVTGFGENCTCETINR